MQNFLRFTFPKKGFRIDDFKENLKHCLNNSYSLPKLKI